MHGDLRTAISEHTRTAAARLAPDTGVMLAAVWFDLGQESPGRLLLLAHHLVIDGVSWRILFADLASAWEALAGRRPIELAPVATSFKRWSELLAEDGRMGSRAGELGRWQQALEAADPDLGARALDRQRDTLATARTLTVRLPAELTGPLLTTVPAAHHGAVNDALLTALAVALRRWRPSDTTAVLIDLEGHGREDVFGDVDLARTVGWFTTLFPVRLDPGAVDWAEFRGGGAAVGAAFKRIKEQLRAIPDNGLGFGTLRYLDPSAGPGFSARVPQVLFNYLGRFPAERDRAWTPAPEVAPLDDVRDPRMPMGHVLDIDAVVRDTGTGPQLSAVLTWAGGVLADADVAALADLWCQALTALVRYTTDPGAGGHTPSDFPLVALDQAQVDELEGAVPDLEDVLPLTPLQAGLLFHTCFDADELDVYTVQVTMTLEGPVDAERLRAACEALLDRHANLRSAFRYLASGEPVAVIPRTVVVPWREVDLTGAEPEARQEPHLAEERRRFDPALAPLLRLLLLLRTEPHRYLLVLTHQHLLLDGWSAVPLIRELSELYACGGDPAGLAPVTPYRDHLAWFAAQDRGAAQDAWRGALAGLDGPTHLAPPDPSRVPVEPQLYPIELSPQLTDAVLDLGRRCGLTVSTLVHGAWAILLAHLTGRDDVVFGVTVSGRTPELAGVESMIGLFINTVPVRVTVAPGESLVAMLDRLQDEQSRLIAHQHMGLSDITRLTGLGDLFDTLIVSESYPDVGNPGPGRRLARDGSRGPGLHPLPLHLGRGVRRAAAPVRGVPRRRVRPRHRRADRRRDGAVVRGDGGRPRTADRRGGRAHPGRTPPYPGRLERHLPHGFRYHRSGPVREPGQAQSGRGSRGV